MPCLTGEKDQIEFGSHDMQFAFVLMFLCIPASSVPIKRVSLLRTRFFSPEGAIYQTIWLKLLYKMQSIIVWRNP